MTAEVKVRIRIEPDGDAFRIKINGGWTRYDRFSITPGKFPAPNSDATRLERLLNSAQNSPEFSGDRERLEQLFESGEPIEWTADIDPFEQD